MKILHIINYYHEGFGYQENWLTYYQRQLGHDVLVVTSDWYFPFPEYESTMYPRLGNRYVGAGQYDDNGTRIFRKKSYFQKIGPPGIVWFSVLKELSTFKPDVIHVHGATNLVLAELFLFQNKYGYKIFIDSHQDESVENDSIGIGYRSYYAMWRIFYHTLNLKKKVSKFLPITQSAKSWLKIRLAINDQNIEISPLGVDIKTMAYDAQLEIDFRRQYKLGDKFIVVNAGKQYKEKRIEWIVDVATSAVNKGVELILILVGDAGEKYNELLMVKLSKLGTNNFIRLPLLARDELRKVYCASDIGVWPGIPSNTIQEAMACRVALILPDDDIVGHLIRNNGIRESQDIDRAACFIGEIATNNNKLHSCKINSEKIANKYNWKIITIKLLDTYEAA